MAKVNPYTDKWLRDNDMIEVSPGVYEKLKYPKSFTPLSKPFKNVFGEHTSATFGILDFSQSIVKINMKPMSVNGAWQGRRFKSKEYIAYTESCMSMLPNITLPEPPYRINFEFGVSNPASDWDNPVKPIQDILQQRYKFNDKDIYEAFVKKIIVPKRQEYFSFELIHIDL